MTAIALDAMGGDNAPEVVVQAACQLSLLEQSPNLLLVGDASQLTAITQGTQHDPNKIVIHHASQSISMEETPKTALAEKPDASVAVAAGLVASGKADALVSAGNTGAVLLAASQHFGRIPGIKRAALAAVYPTERRHGQKEDPFALMLDVGATLEVGAQELVAFAIMGSAYAACISTNNRPKVALLSNGSEPSKGSQAIVEAHQLLKQHPHLNFIGNIEGVDIPRGTADVIVTGGFVGNVVLKMLEGVSETVVGLARYAYRTKLLWRAGLWMLSSGIQRIKQLTDWQQYGGAPILGLNKVCIKAHGRSGEQAIANAVKVASKAVRTDLVGTIRRGMEEIER